MMVVRVFIMKIIKFVILYIISFYSFGFSAEKTILECNYISGTKETNIKDLKSYKPYITKRILEIDVDKGTLVDVNLVYNLKAKSPGRLSFEYKGNYNTSNENVDPLMNFTSLYNIDRIKKGPVDWTKIESTGKIFTDHSFPADVSMLAWKEYPRTIGGLAKYISWFKDFRRPRDLIV